MNRQPARQLPTVYTIPPDADFSKVLVEAVLGGRLPHDGASPPDPLQLADWTILVPTRRAARILTHRFAQLSNPGASLLPAIRPLGDVDEDDIQAGAAMSGAGELDADPAITGLRRQFVLAGMIVNWAKDRSDSELGVSVLAATGQALSLADSLGDLIDGFETDEVPLSAIAGILQDDQALHHQDMLDFMNILHRRYPEYLRANGLAGAMQRRSALIRAEADRMSAHPPGAPVIAAGSTGSIPATAQLLKTIAHLPLGAVVLPGLDSRMDEDSWQVLEPQHPQFGFKELLARIGIERGDVQDLLKGPAENQNTARRWLLSEVMRPSRTSDKWRGAIADNLDQLENAADGLTWLEAPDQHTEAQAIALLMRQTLEKQGTTAALITPDRQLARKVKSQLRRWSLDVDDSAGEPVLRSPQGSFMCLLLDAALARFAPGSLVALLNHPFALFGLTRPELSLAAVNLEMAVLRSRLVPPGLGDLLHDARQSHAAVSRRSHRHVRNLGDADWQAVFDLIARLQSQLALLEDVFASTMPCPLDEYVTAHLQVSEAITVNSENAQTPLWQGEAGEVLAGMFALLREDAGECPPLLPHDYAALIRKLLAGTPVHPHHVGHLQLAIYGLLEARLVRADVTILGGLNESIWPGEAEIDPWLNRPQKSALELQSPERRMGLMAHDFVQAAAAGKTWLTSSRKIDGQPVVASRWLLRMKALLDAAGKTDSIEPNEDWLGWALGMDQPANHTPVKPPQPCPPVDARPDRLSVTRIDRLINDPYGIFAGHILGLEAVEPLDGEFGARERGTLVHSALERFVRKNPGTLPDNAADLLMEEISALFAEAASDPAVYAFWQPRMQRLAVWFVDQERTWRSDTAGQHVEQKGEYGFDVAGRPFTLSGVADRIDVKLDSTARLIDYKTGALPAAKPSSQGYSFQLDLEAYMAAHGAFPTIGDTEASETVFVHLTGGDPPGQLRQTSNGVSQRAQDAFEGLLNLLEDYARPDQPYLALDRQTREERAFDFDHLSRWREWAHLRRGGEGS